MVNSYHFKKLALLLLLISTAAIANNVDQWLTKEIKVEDGLPDSTVFSIQQDKTGFIWFGTTNGLARYDGYSFKVFKHDGTDSKTLSNNNTGNIFVDSNNVMWIGTFGGGLNSLDLNSGELIRYPYSSTKLDEMVSENVQTFHEDKESNLWIGTATGLYMINDGELTHYNHVEKNPNSLIHSRVWNIAESKNGDLWIGTSDGLSHLDPKTGKFNNHKLPNELTVDISSNQFRKLFITDEYLWIGSSTGLYSFNIQSKIFNKHSSIRNMKINDILLMNEDQLLIASMKGIFQFDIQQNTFRMNNDGEYWQALKHVDVRDMFFDKSGLLWLALRDSGVIKVDQFGGLFQQHNSFIPNLSTNTLNKQVWSIEFDSEDNLYLGTSETLLKNNKNQEFKKVSTKDQNEIPGIIRDTLVSQNQDTWIASSEGLYFLEHDTIIAKNITEPFDLVGIKTTDVFSVEETDDGEIWLALYNLGVLRWNPETSIATLIQSYSGGSLTDINIVHIYQDSYKNIWIGSNLIGAFRYIPETEELKLFSHELNNESSLSSNRIKDIFQDSNDRLWIATFRGLNLYNQEDDSFKRYMVADGLLENTINAVLEDSDKHLWLVYKYGISHFVPENLVINNYLLDDGKKNDGINARSATIDKQNRIYFGTTDGYFTFNPNDLNESISYQPTLALTDVRINNKSFSFSELAQNNSEFILDSSDRDISLNFASLDYKISEQIQYKYRINGLHEEWLNVTSNRQIDLNNLNPGKYNIEIKATNNDGRWTEHFLNLDLKVSPVWWNMGWVRILFLLTGILIALFFHLYRTFKIKKQNELLESTVDKRTTELVELNNQLEQASQTDFLTGLYNRSGFIKRFKARVKKTFGCCIVVTDIDNFKKINDIHSHSAGDSILQQVTQVMLSLKSKDDLIARWGGEEFIFYLSNKDAEEAFDIIERIRLEIQKTKFQYKNKIIPVTCTFGICQRVAGMSLNDCINAADESMYQGKKRGKNITIVSKDPLFKDPK